MFGFGLGSCESLLVCGNLAMFPTSFSLLLLQCAEAQRRNGGYSFVDNISLTGYSLTTGGSQMLTPLSTILEGSIANLMAIQAREIVAKGELDSPG
jgi:hypothetical protein